MPQLDTLGLDLLAQLLRYAPAQRISCRRALAHPWFDEVRAAEEARGRAAQQAAAGAQAALEQRWQAAAAAAAALCAAVSRREPAEPLATPVAGTAHLLACEGEPGLLVGSCCAP